MGKSSNENWGSLNQKHKREGKKKNGALKKLVKQKQENLIIIKKTWGFLSRINKTTTSKQ